MSGRMFERATVRIPREDIIPLINSTGMFDFVPNISEIMIGSTGKKLSSGDIDLVMDSKMITKESMISSLVSAGFEIQARGSMVSFLIPYRGSHVQTDLIFSDDPEFTKLYYFSDPMNSKFTGADRQKLISALSYCHRKLRHDIDTGKVLEEFGPVWTPTGLQMRKKTRPQDKETFSIHPLGEPVRELRGIQLMLFTGFWNGDSFWYQYDPVFYEQNFLKSVETISDGMEYRLPYDFRVRVWEKFEQDLS